MSINIFFVFLLVVNIVYIRAENCKLSDKCRLVDINGDDEWLKTPGHYRNIQDFNLSFLSVIKISTKAILGLKHDR